MARSILYISKNGSQQDKLASMLMPIEFHLTCVEGLAGLQSVRDGLPEIVLTEASLDDGDWHSVLLALRDLDPTVQVLVTHTDADAHFWADALEAGAYDIVTQPFHAAEVQRLVLSAWLKHESAVQESRRKPAMIAEVPRTARAAS